MTKPTVTEPQIYYGLFRKDALIHTIEHTLQGETYPSLSEATAARNTMVASLPTFLASLVDIRVIDGEVSESEFGKNPLAWYN